MGYIFISYSHKDKVYAHRLHGALQDRGFDVWIDDRIDYGTEWPKVIQKYLDGCDAFILLASENAFASTWVQNELARAGRKKKPIFPLLLQGDPWLSVEATQYGDVRDGTLPDEKFYQRLSSVVAPGAAHGEVAIAKPAPRKNYRVYGVAGILLIAVAIWAGMNIFGNPLHESPNSSLTLFAPIQSTGVSDIAVAAGFGARGNGWQLYFTNPTNNQNPASLIDASNLINKTIFPTRGVSVYEQPNQDSLIIARPSPDEDFLITGTNQDSLWLHVRLQDDNEGWMQTQDVLLVSATPLAPTIKSQYGINIRLVDAIGKVRNTLDIAAFVLNEKEITNAILEAHQNGVIVRIVTDTENGLENPDSTLPQLIAEGIPVVADNRQSLMHNKFMILDGASVWTGSWNYSRGSTFNNNENALVFTSPQIASYYQIEFNKMFEAGEFGTRKTPSENPQVNIGDGTVRVYFAPDDNIPSTIIALLSSAQKSIRLMAFSFTLSDYADGIIQALQRGVKFQGIFEGIAVESGEAPRLQSAGADIRRDGNQYLLHHDIFIIDDSIVITGSMGFSQSASEVNDENVLIISDINLANAYNDEFDRLWEVAK